MFGFSVKTGRFRPIQQEWFYEKSFDLVGFGSVIGARGYAVGSEQGAWRLY